MNYEPKREKLMTHDTNHITQNLNWLIGSFYLLRSHKIENNIQSQKEFNEQLTSKPETNLRDRSMTVWNGLWVFPASVSGILK